MATSRKKTIYRSSKTGRIVCVKYLRWFNSRIPIIALILGMTCLATGCFEPARGAGVRWTNYPKLSRSPTVYKWLVVECQFADVPTIPTGLDTNIRQFLGLTGAGYGNMVDYYHDVSYNNAAFSTEFVD